MKDLFIKNLIGVILLSLLLSLSAMPMLDCSSSNKHRRKGKLSDAMEKASDENKGDRKVETTPDDLADKTEDEEEENENSLDGGIPGVIGFTKELLAPPDSISQTANIANMPEQSINTPGKLSDTSPWLTFVWGDRPIEAG